MSCPALSCVLITTHASVFFLFLEHAVLAMHSGPSHTLSSRVLHPHPSFPDLLSRAACYYTCPSHLSSDPVPQGSPQLPRWGRVSLLCALLTPQGTHHSSVCIKASLITPCYPPISLHRIQSVWHLISLVRGDAASVEFGQRQGGSPRVSPGSQAFSFCSTTLVHGYQH